MPPQRIGILYPGVMGISIATAVLQNGHHVYWASEGRSGATSRRTGQFGLLNTYRLAKLCAECSLIISIRPPHMAETVAQQVAAHAFTGPYLHANAIAPQRAVRASQALTEAVATFVDGGIIGGPAWAYGTTSLYLSGPCAHEVAAYFLAGPLETHILSATVGDASALKMCYAAYTKGTTALLCAILAAAVQLGVREALHHLWAQEEATFTEQTTQRVRQVTTMPGDLQERWRKSRNLQRGWGAGRFSSWGSAHQSSIGIVQRCANTAGAGKGAGCTCRKRVKPAVVQPCDRKRAISR